MANALLLELRVRCGFRSRWRQGFSAFRGESENRTVVPVSGQKLPAGFALDEERCFRLIRRRQ
jgi:hypothetical protein